MRGFLSYLLYFYSLFRPVHLQRALILPIVFAVVPGYALAQGGACPSNWNSIDSNGNSVPIASYAGIKSCYYASKAVGSDSNAGTDEAHAWAHIPGMAGCTGNCAAASPASGQGFVLRGGDTWTGSDFQINWNWGGSGASNQIYIGVDQSWYNSSCGSGWCRPIADLSGSGSNFFVADSGKSYWWLDNVEIVGLCNSGNGVYVQGASNIRASQLYFHAWTHCTNSDNVGFFSQGGSGAVADHNIIDGSDSSKNTFNGFYSYWSVAKYNYVSYVVSGVLGNTDEVHDNIIENIVTSADADHCNGIFTFGPESGNTQLIYNNLVSFGTGCPGGVNMWFNGNSGAVASRVGWGFNNILLNMSGGNAVNFGDHASGNQGTYYWFNNTVDGTNGGCGGTPSNGPAWSIYDDNNHYIACPYIPDVPPSGGLVIGPCNNGAGNGCHDLVQSVSAANGQGYTISEPAPYSPVGGCTSSKCSTVLSGGNLISAICLTLNGVNADAYSACQKGGTGGLVYNASTHSLTTPRFSPTSRAATGNWDAGAYQFGTSNGPTAPSNLSLTLTNGATGAAVKSSKSQ